MVGQDRVAEPKGFGGMQGGDQGHHEQRTKKESNGPKPCGEGRGDCWPAKETTLGRQV